MMSIIHNDWDSDSSSVISANFFFQDLPDESAKATKDTTVSISYNTPIIIHNRDNFAFGIKLDSNFPSHASKLSIVLPILDIMIPRRWRNYSSSLASSDIINQAFLLEDLEVENKVEQAGEDADDEGEEGQDQNDDNRIFSQINSHDYFDEEKTPEVSIIFNDYSYINNTNDKLNNEEPEKSHIILTMIDFDASKDYSANVENSGSTIIADDLNINDTTTDEANNDDSLNLSHTLSRIVERIDILEFRYRDNIEYSQIDTIDDSNEQVSKDEPTFNNENEDIDKQHTTHSLFLESFLNDFTSELLHITTRESIDCCKEKKTLKVISPYPSPPSSPPPPRSPSRDLFSNSVLDTHNESPAPLQSSIISDVQSTSSSAQSNIITTNISTPPSTSTAAPVSALTSAPIEKSQELSKLMKHVPFIKSNKKKAKTNNIEGWTERYGDLISLNPLMSPEAPETNEIANNPASNGAKVSISNISPHVIINLQEYQFRKIRKVLNDVLSHWWSKEVTNRKKFGHDPLKFTKGENIFARYVRTLKIILFDQPVDDTGENDPVEKPQKFSKPIKAIRSRRSKLMSWMVRNHLQRKNFVLRLEETGCIIVEGKYGDP